MEKRTVKMIAVMLMALVGFTACSDDDNNGNGNLKEYALEVKFGLTPNDTTVADKLQMSIETALSSVGVGKDESYIYITARDSADAAPKVQEIGKKVEAVLNRNASEMYGSAYIMAIEKNLLEANDSKKRQWACWYETTYPESDNGIYNGIWCGVDDYYVYDLEIFNQTVSKKSAPNSAQINKTSKNGVCFRYVDTYDLNSWAGGAYIYLIMRGAINVNHPTYRKRFVTDVVMLNTGSDSHYPEYVDLNRDGQTRRYYPVFTSDKGANGSTAHDLNNGAGGPYLWMYYTTDYRDGWVLANKTPNPSSKTYTFTRVVSYRKEETENIRFMHSFVKNSEGEWTDNGIADMNKGVGGTDLFLLMGYLKID